MQPTMNARPRLLWNSFATVGSVMSNKTKPPTHYETLEVNSRATQSEIKSAYFKLSKEYHPDKNRSEAATAKFRDIAEAYEVLGNFQSRKMYDRSVLTHTKYHAPQRGKQEDPRMKQYQAQAAVFRDQQKTGAAPVYDFDAWTKAHYGRTLHRTLRDKVETEKRRQSRVEDRVVTGPYSTLGYLWVVISMAIVFTLMTWQYTDYDKPFKKMRDADVSNNGGTTKRKSERDNATLEPSLNK